LFVHVLPPVLRTTLAAASTRTAGRATEDSRVGFCAEGDEASVGVVL
jgi:hypothetical protein